LVIAMMLAPIVAFAVGLTLVLGAGKLEAWSERIYSRSPHLLPFRRVHLPKNVYLWGFRFFGVVWIASAFALLLLAH
jgi:hypothetical protein